MFNSNGGVYGPQESTVSCGLLLDIRSVRRSRARVDLLGNESESETLCQTGIHRKRGFGPTTGSTPPSSTLVFDAPGVVVKAQVRHKTEANMKAVKTRRPNFPGRWSTNLGSRTGEGPSAAGRGHVRDVAR